MADYTLKDGKGSKVREDSGSQEAFVDANPENLVARSAMNGSEVFVVQEGVSDPEKLFPATLHTYLFERTRYTNIWVPASKMVPSVTDGAALQTVEYPTNDITHKVMRFDGLTKDTHAEFDVAFPAPWNNSNLKAKVFWTAGGAANPNEWVRFYVAARTRQDGYSMDGVLDTAENMDDQLINDDVMHVTPASDFIGTNASSDDAMIHFKLSRDYDYSGGGTAMDVDADVLGVWFQILVNELPAAW